MAVTHASQKRYPAQLRERAVQMAFETIEENNGERFEVVTRVARELRIGVESLLGW